MAESDRRERILQAARFLILKQGLRATSMEAIAAEARVAKPTLYRYYGDKNAVFSALVTELLVDLHAGFLAALEGDGPLIGRVSAALVAKYRMVADYMQGSAFADELYDEHDRLSGPQVQVAESESDLALARALQQGGVKDAGGMAALLSAAAYGLFRKGRAEGLEAGIGLLVERVLGPEVGRAK